MTIHHINNSRPRRRVLVELQVITAASLTTAELELAVRQDVADSIRGYNYTVKEINVTADLDPLEDLLDDLEILRLLEEARTALAEARQWLAQYEALGLSDLLQYAEEA